MPAKTSEHPRAFGPDLIRATAIVLVLMAHTVPGGTHFPLLGSLRYFWGMLGVELFFLLSGYLIGGILMKELFAGRLDKPGGVVEFWKRRWFRTLPNYYLFLLLLLLLSPLSVGGFPPESGRFFWFGQALFSVDPDFFVVAWSLAVEEWFYLLFPVVLFIFARLLPRRHQALLVTIVIFLVVPVIIRAFISPTVNWDGGVRRVTLPRLDAIAYGVLLAWVKNYGGSIWNFMVRLWPVGVAAVLGLTIHLCYQNATGKYFTTDSIAYRVFYFNLTSICIGLLFPKPAEMAAPGGRFEKVFRNLSLWSYSMYLSHFFFISLLAIIFVHIPLIHGWESVIACPVIWLTTISGSAWIYRVYEKPLMNLRDQPLKDVFKRCHDVKPPA